jgi:hypothetical protein
MKAKGYKSEKHRLAHPYQDATSDWLRENDDALDMLRGIQLNTSREARWLTARSAKAWLDYCNESDAPAAVTKQAESNYKLAQRRALDLENTTL